MGDAGGVRLMVQLAWPGGMPRRRRSPPPLMPFRRRVLPPAPWRSVASKRPSVRLPDTAVCRGGAMERRQRFCVSPCTAVATYFSTASRQSTSPRLAYLCRRMFPWELPPPHAPFPPLLPSRIGQCQQHLSPATRQRRRRRGRSAEAAALVRGSEPTRRPSPAAHNPDMQQHEQYW